MALPFPFVIVMGGSMSGLGRAVARPRFAKNLTFLSWAQPNPAQAHSSPAPQHKTDEGAAMGSFLWGAEKGALQACGTMPPQTDRQQRQIYLFRISPAQNKFLATPLVIVLLLPLLSAASACPPSDRAALLAFRAALSEPYIGIFSSWSGGDCCSRWYGVSCDPTTGRVADLTLRGESEDPILTRSGRSGLMTGRISADVCRLGSLTTLIVADWKQISGPIPPCITSLPFLRILDLVGNRLSGPLPADIGRLSRLTVLNVADNQISGQIPPSLADLTTLMHLDLSSNQIGGPIPSNFGNLRMLSRALLGRNRISGGIPASIGQLSRLSDLDLSCNQISGGVPSALGSMSVLSSLYLDGNQISGGIPASILGSKGLGILNLSRNAVEGPIPDAFWSGSYFTALDLSYNRLTGRVPRSLTSAAYVGHLDLSHNHLCGPIPAGSPFDHLEAASFVSNDCLCGSPLPACA